MPRKETSVMNQKIQLMGDWLSGAYSLSPLRDWKPLNPSAQVSTRARLQSSPVRSA